MKYTEEQILVLVAILLRHKTIKVTLESVHKYFVNLKEISQIVKIPPKRLYDLMIYYIDSGKFKQSHTEKAKEKTPVELIEYAINKDTL